MTLPDDPDQFDELQSALRSMGAITNTVLKQKLHWYVKNSKRARAAAKELLKQQQQQQQQPESLADEGPVTPPTESKILNSDQMLRLATDPSPKSVHGIFVPHS